MGCAKTRLGHKIPPTTTWPSSGARSLMSTKWRPPALPPQTDSTILMRSTLVARSYSKAQVLHAPLRRPRKGASMSTVTLNSPATAHHPSGHCTPALTAEDMAGAAIETASSGQIQPDRAGNASVGGQPPWRRSDLPSLRILVVLCITRCLRRSPASAWQPG